MATSLLNVSLGRVAPTIGCVSRECVSTAGGDRWVVMGASRDGSFAGATAQASINGAPLVHIGSSLGSVDVAALELRGPRGGFLEFRGGGGDNLLPSPAVATFFWSGSNRTYIGTFQLNDTQDAPYTSSSPSGAFGSGGSDTAAAATIATTCTAASNGALVGVATCEANTTVSSTSGATAAAATTGTISSTHGYEVGLTSGSQSCDWTIGTNAVRRACTVAYAPRAQGWSSFSPAIDATGVSPTFGTLTVTMTAGTTVGSGNVRLYKTVLPSSSPTMVHQTGGTSTGTDAPTINTPGHATNGGPGLAANDLIIIVGNLAGAAHVVPPAAGVGWTITHWHPGGDVTGYVAWKRATGSEGATLSSGASIFGGTNDHSYEAFCVRGGHLTDAPYVRFNTTQAGGTTTAPNPLAVQLPYSEPCLVLIGNATGTGSTSVSGWPTGFSTNGVYRESTNASTGSRCGLATSWMQDTGISFDPGALTLGTGRRSVPMTIVVRPDDPSTLEATIPAASCTFTGNDIQIPISTLTGSTAYHVQIDDQLLPDWFGVYWREWRFTTGAAAAGGPPITASQRIARNVYPRRMRRAA